jgi:hypothetical protein
MIGNFANMISITFFFTKALAMLLRFQSDSISSIGRPVPFAYTDFSFFSAISASSAFYFRIFVP